LNFLQQDPEPERYQSQKSDPDQDAYQNGLYPQHWAQENDKKSLEVAGRNTVLHIPTAHLTLTRIQQILLVTLSKKNEVLRVGWQKPLR
jgi:hypothetical protein